MAQPYPGAFSLFNEQLCLRPWQKKDAAWYVQARDELIFQWTTEDRSLTISETKAAIEAVTADPLCYSFAIVARPDAQLMGNIALVLQGQRGEVMYWLAKNGRGRGLATGALQLMTTWALAELEVTAVWLKTNKANIASQKVAQRAGFELQSISKDTYFYFEKRATTTN